MEIVRPPVVDKSSLPKNTRLVHEHWLRVVNVTGLPKTRSGDVYETWPSDEYQRMVPAIDSSRAVQRKASVLLKKVTAAFLTFPRLSAMRCFWLQCWHQSTTMPCMNETRLICRRRKPRRVEGGGAHREWGGHHGRENATRKRTGGLESLRAHIYAAVQPTGHFLGM